MGPFLTFAASTVDNSGMFQLLLSSACRVQTFSASHPTPPWRRPGVHKELGADTARTARTAQRDVPHHMTPFSAYKAGQGKRGEVKSDGVCLPKPWLQMVEPGFPGDG